MRSRVFTLACVVSAVAAFGLAPTPADKPSALEADPGGWIDLLADAGPELKGWTRGPIPPKAPLRPESPWSFDAKTGVLLCDGRGLHEWLRHDVERDDFIYHVEWRFVPVTEGKKGYNSGVYVRNSADAAIWHQAQTGGGSGGFLFGETRVDGKTKRINLSKQSKTDRVKPAGEWNVFELTCRGKNVTLRVNGEITCEWPDCDVAKGFVGLEAEGYKIEFRKVMLKPIK